MRRERREEVLRRLVVGGKQRSDLEALAAGAGDREREQRARLAQAERERGCGLDPAVQERRPVGPEAGASKAAMASNGSEAQRHEARIRGREAADAVHPQMPMGERKPVGA